jgi:hypothetical protein
VVPAVIRRLRREAARKAEEESLGGLGLGRAAAAPSTTAEERDDDGDARSDSSEEKSVTTEVTESTSAPPSAARRRPESAPPPARPVMRSPPRGREMLQGFKVLSIALTQLLQLLQ